MSISRQHFEVIAKSLNSFWQELTPGTQTDDHFTGLVNELAHEFSQMNPNFSKKKFRDAVYYEELLTVKTDDVSNVTTSHGMVK